MDEDNILHDSHSNVYTFNSEREKEKEKERGELNNQRERVLNGFDW